MPLVSVTRLRLRSLRFLPAFAWYAQRSAHQAKRAAGNAGVLLRKTRGLTFWTMSVWRDEHAMAAFRGAPPHRDAMPRLAHWCDEASVAHWPIDAPGMPDWETAAGRLATGGRLSRVDHPSADQRAGRIKTD
jgi:Domain of unknown function (DUF3291)